MGFVSLNAQVAIANGGKLSSPGASIEFGPATGGVGGLLVPRVIDVDSEPTRNAVVGTFVFDIASQKVKMATTNKPGTPTTVQTLWFDFTNGASTPTNPYENPADLAESANAQVIIGNNTPTVPGILVLDSDPATKPQAMVLPRVSSVDNIISPSAGMIVYVTGSDRFAVYNGSQWTFWAPAP